MGPKIGIYILKKVNIIKSKIYVQNGNSTVKKTYIVKTRYLQNTLQ